MVNCDKAKEIGLAAMEGMFGQTFGNVKLKQKDKVIPLSTMHNAVRIRDEVLAVKTMQIFNRIIYLKNAKIYADHLKFSTMIMLVHNL